MTFLLIPTHATAQDTDQQGTDLSRPESEPAGNMYDDPFQDKADEEIELRDPFRPWNRTMFWFNDRAYQYALEPATRGYRELFGTTIRKGIRNVFLNLDEPRNLVNAILQGRPNDAGVTLTRFLINTTVGLGGVTDPASPTWTRRERRLDQTFAKWHIPPGPYLVWPLYGSSSVRGTVGEFGDSFLYPPYYLEGEDAHWARFGLYTVRNVNELSFELGRYEEFKEMSVSPYAGLKNAYEQRLEKRLKE